MLAVPAALVLRLWIAGTACAAAVSRIGNKHNGGWQALFSHSWLSRAPGFLSLKKNMRKFSSYASIQ